MTTQQKYDAYKFSMSLGDRLAQQRKEKLHKANELIKLISCIVVVAGLTAIAIQSARLEQDFISPIQTIITSSIAVIIIVMAISTYAVVDKQDDEY